MIAWIMLACGPKQTTNIAEPPQQQLQETIVGEETLQQVDLNKDGKPDYAINLEPGMVIQKLDINGDGKVDVTNNYKVRDDSTRILVYKSVDLNWDGYVDVQTWFNEQGEIEREAIDGDFDGIAEWVDYYKGNKLVRSEIDTDFDGVADLKRFYKSQRISEKRFDSDGDGKTDVWQYFDAEGNVQKIGRDVDGDGEVDSRN